MTVANLVNIIASQGRDAQLVQKLRRVRGEGVLNLLADERTEDVCLNPSSTLWVKRINQAFEIIGNMSLSQAQTALGTAMKSTAIMWNPLNPRGQSARLRLLDPCILKTEGQRAAVLVRHVEVLTWPTLEPALQRPTLIVGLANDNRARGKPIPAAHDRLGPAVPTSEKPGGNLTTTRSLLGNSTGSAPVVSHSHSATDSAPTTLVYALAEKVAQESTERSAYLRLLRCSGVPVFEADKRSNLVPMVPNTKEAIADSDMLTPAEIAARLRCSKAHVCHAIRGQVNGVRPLLAISFGRRKLVRRESLESWPSQNDPAAASEAPCPASSEEPLLPEARISYEAPAGR